MDVIAHDDDSYADRCWRLCHRRRSSRYGRCPPVNPLVGMSAKVIPLGL